MTEVNYYMEREVKQKCKVKNANNDCSSFQRKEPEPERKIEIIDPLEVQGKTGVHWTAWLFLCLVHFTVGAWIGTLV